MSIIDKQIVLQEAKRTMEYIVRGLTLENIQESNANIQVYFDFIRILSELSVIELEDSTNVDEVIISREAESVTSELEKATEEDRKCLISIVNVQQKNEYRFERKLRGGILPDLNGGCFVPEMFVRELGITHGDFLAVENKRTFGEQTRYDYKLAARGDGADVEGRVEVKYCLVENVDGIFCVRQKAEEESFDRNISFKIKHSDLTDMRLVAGDVVDIAYYDNSPQETMKVIWKYDVSSVSNNKRAIKPAHRKLNEKTEKEQKEFPIENPDLFNGKHILVVGAKPKEAGYKAVIEALGATVDVFAGTEAKSRTRAAIQRSDAVVMVTVYLGHGKSSGSPQVVEMCKKAKVPFGFVDSMGNESFIRGVEEVLQRNQETEGVLV